MNRIISLSVEDMYIKYTGEAFGATGSHNAVTLRMTFGPAWEGTAKTAYFTDALGNTSVALVLGLDTLVDGAYEVDVPSEALKAAGVATITIKGVLVSGETTTKAITTAAGHFRVLDSELPDSAGNAGTITPSEKDQLQAEIDGLETLFTTAKAAAEAAAANAKASETNAKASETAASGSASQASAAAAAAAQSAASVDGINKTAQSWAVGGTGTRPGEDTDNAKYWAKKAQAVVGGDFATKVEAQGYVTAHNESNAAHSDIRKALEGKAAATHASQHGKDGEDPITPAAIGAASLGADGKVPASQLPETDTYTKDEILKDATAAKFGKDTGAVPDEVLDVLSKSILEGTYPVVDVYAGQNWEKGTVPNVSGSVWQQIAVANNILFSFPISGTTAVMSTDGKTWTTLTIPTVSGGYNYGGRHRIVYVGDTYYLLIPITSSPYKAIIYATQNLSTWTLKCTLSLTNIAFDLFYSNYLSKFVLIDIYGKVYLSSDAENWESTYSLGTSASSRPMFNNGIDGPDGFYIAVPVSKKIQVFKLKSDSFETVFTSADLSNTIENVAFVKFKGKYFVYSAYGIAHSEDLKAWQLSDANYQSSSTNPTTITQQLACSDVNVLIKFSTESLVSFDGLNFKRITDGVASQQGSMAYINGVFCFHSQGAPSTINPYYTPDTTFKDEPGLVDVLGNMVNIPLKQIAGATQCEVGSYVGANEDTKTIKCSFSPKFFAITSAGRGVYGIPIYYAPLPEQNVSYNFVYLTISSASSEIVSRSGATTIERTSNGVKISSSRFSSDAFNDANATYYYLFIG